MIHLNAYDWPNLKEHKVGDKVQLIIEAEITGMNKESDYYFGGPMEDGEKRPKILRRITSYNVCYTKLLRSQWQD